MGRYLSITSDFDEIAFSFYILTCDDSSAQLPTILARWNASSRNFNKIRDSIPGLETAHARALFRAES